jgi:hypothetical protein
VDDDVSAGWRTALPRLQGLWERHKERWPAAERSPIDSSKDEEGSWRGDGLGQYLNAEENLVTERALDRVHDTEREVTGTMKAVEALSFEESMRFTESQIALFALTEDAAEGQLAFREKRAPNWTGR